MLEKLIALQEQIKQTYDLQDYHDKSLINWGCKRNSAIPLPVVSKPVKLFNKYPCGKSFRLRVGISYPFSVTSSAIKRHIDRVAATLSCESSHPEITAYEETMHRWGFPTEAEGNEIWSCQIVAIDSGFYKSQCEWHTPGKAQLDYLNQHCPMHNYDDLIFDKYTLSNEHWEHNWQVIKAAIV